MFYIPHFEQTTTWVRLNKLGPITQRAVLRWSGETGESWVVTSQPHGKSSTDQTAAL